MSSIATVAYLTLFAGTAFLLVFIALWLGRFLRPNSPSPDKLEPYECGEPPVGSAFVQFDLRFYVVALVFIIFEVELAFFFPWADVYGKVTRLSAGSRTVQSSADLAALSPPTAKTSTVGQASTSQQLDAAAPVWRQFALAAMADIGVFFAVLLVGFAYLWQRGDLTWVRAARDATLPSSDRTRSGGPAV